MKTEVLADHILRMAAGRTRLMAAIAGPPGSGKSTMADQLASELRKRNESCAVVPMDGFHLDNRILTERDLLSRKGAPHTFDATGFVHLVKRLKGTKEDVVIPVFDRTRDIAVAGASIVLRSTRIVLVEGNYLLLKQQPWQELQTLWDESIFLDPGLGVIETRLIQRWLDNGLTQEAATKRALENDIPNARTVLQDSFAASVVIS